MATFIELGLFKYFSTIFATLLVFIAVYALLAKTKVLGENKLVQALVAFALAFLTILFNDVIKIINFMSPWFVLFFLFLVLLLVIFKFMGASDESIATWFTKEKTMTWVLVAVALIILLAAIAHVYGERLLPITAAEATAEPTFKENVMRILFHPAVLGIVFILLVAVFTIALITKEKI